jgi:hypothetical protein
MPLDVTVLSQLLERIDHARAQVAAALAAAIPSCNWCRQPLSWSPRLNRWWCQSCQM